MQSPPAEWVLDALYFTAKDILRARGEADGDTLSEVVRDLVDRHPRGRLVLAAILTAAPIGFWRHIVKET